MVTESSSTAGGQVKPAVRETDAPGEGQGPLWLVRADDATFQAINAGAYDIREFAKNVNTYDENRKGQVYDITCDATWRCAPPNSVRPR